MQQAVAKGAWYPSRAVERVSREGEGAMREKSGWFRAGLAIAAATAAWGAAFAQVSSTPTAIPNQYPPALPFRKGPPPPRLAMELVREIPIPGPLIEGDLRLTPDGIEVPLPDGVAVASWQAEGGDAVVRRPGAPTSTVTDGWTLHPSGRLRFRALPDGYLLAERYHRCAPKGWRKTWRLRIPAAVPSPPVVVGRRLCFTALDDQAYCLRADNGHRLWAVDLGERVSRTLAVWSGVLPVETTGGEVAKAFPLDLLLVVPDSGASVIALDPFNGQRLTTFTPPKGWYVSAPVVLPDAQVAVARKGYAEEEAALSFLRLRAPASAAAPSSEPVLYNPTPPRPNLSDGGGSLGAESGDDEPERSRQDLADRALPGDDPVSEGRR